jgi:hypothetical protein
VHKSVLNRWQNEERKHGFDMSGNDYLQELRKQLIADG